MAKIEQSENARQLIRKRGVCHTGFGLVSIFVLIECLVLVVLVPRVERIFESLLKGFPKPTITHVLLDFRWAAAAFSCLCLLIAFRASQRGKPNLIYGVLCVLLAQLMITIVALFLPLAVTIQSIN